jgi:molybdate transport system permease protein
MEFTPIILSLQMAFITSVILILIGIPIAYSIAYSKRRWMFFIETMISLPLVLPPTVIGFYLLIAFSGESFIGKLLNDYFSIQLVFTFTGLIFASVIYGLPFTVNPLVSGFRAIPSAYRETAAVLGKTKIQTLLYVLLPNMKQSIITAFIMTFAHAIGEFGVILMIGGNIPGETKLASLAIYDEVEAMNYDVANKYAVTMVLIAFVLLALVYFINRKKHSV